jgi:hypothetical protein
MNCNLAQVANAKIKGQIKHNTKTYPKSITSKQQELVDRAALVDDDVWLRADFLLLWG